MKLAVSSAGMNTEAQIDACFCRCACYIIFDTNTLEYELLPNHMQTQNPTVCKALAQLLMKHDIRTVITGGCDREILEIFQSENIQVIFGMKGSVFQGVSDFVQGAFRPVSVPHAESSFGLRHFLSSLISYEEDEDTHKLVY